MPTVWTHPPAARSARQPFRWAPAREAAVLASRSVRVGGKSRDELRRELERGGVKLNRAGEDLFANPAFTTSTERYTLECVEVSVADLGHPGGATMETLVQSAAGLGLALCPLEVGPHLRLQYLDQPEGSLDHPPPRHRAPPGSLTVASPTLSDDHEVPKGFYLRKIRGELWLRGYWARPDNVWVAEARLLFCRPHREPPASPESSRIQGRDPRPPAS